MWVRSPSGVMLSKRCQFRRKYMAYFIQPYHFFSIPSTYLFLSAFAASLAFPDPQPHRLLQLYRSIQWHHHFLLCLHAQILSLSTSFSFISFVLLSSTSSAYQHFWVDSASPDFHAHQLVSSFSVVSLFNIICIYCFLFILRSSASSFMSLSSSWVF